VPNPEKLKLSRGTSPVRTSQTANNSIPMFLVIFIGGLLGGVFSVLDVEAYGMAPYSAVGQAEPRISSVMIVYGAHEL
jgi:hypothetical protein